MDRPPYCPDEIYELMLSCWRVEPDERPTFTEICAQIMQLLESANQQNYIDALPLDIEEVDEGMNEEVDSNSKSESEELEDEEVGSNSNSKSESEEVDV